MLISVSRISNGFLHELILIDFVNNTTDTLTSTGGGDVWSSPLASDLNGDGYIDIVSVTQNNNPFVADGISIQSHATNFQIPTKGLSWSSYMGNEFDAHFIPFFKDCNTNSSLYLYPSTACPNEQSGGVNLLTTNSSSLYSYSWSNGAVTEDITDVPAGNYSVIVSDLNGCQSEANTMVDEYTTTTSVPDVSETGGNDDDGPILTSAVAAVILVIANTAGTSMTHLSCKAMAVHHLKPINTFITYLRAHTAPLLLCPMAVRSAKKLRSISQN